MNILTLVHDSKEISFIQQALGVEDHTLVTVSSSEQAWEAIQAGGARFLLMDWETDDAAGTQLIQRIRASTFAKAVYIFVLTSSTLEDGSAPHGMDDFIHKPYKAAELKTRVILAGRILSLAGNLAVAREQLESHAVFDTLTGFMNRAAFLRQSAGELERSRRASLPLSLIALDIDDFKTINDMFGAELGDEALEVVAQAIREKSRPYDCIGRWTGDEFVLALPGVIGADAEKVAERVIAGVRGTRIEVPNEPPLAVKVSAGIASLARITTSTEIEPVIQQARQAVARAKEAGGNQVFLVYL
ncbi:MAG: diguanylate cyclase [Anaerolineales bacterium]|jgi:diguanylate cyclase (GGDEF)-like protein|nr:diguanylate cyclase [Anaerolineales bacterium]